MLRLASLILLCWSSITHAGFVTGTITEYQNNTPPPAGFSELHTVDFWYFQTSALTTVSLDILAYEFDPLTRNFVDFNGNGIDDVMDSMLWVFRVNGSLGWEDLIASSDDALYGSDSNGSLADPVRTTHSLDPFLSLDLGPGRYIAMVGGCCGNNTINFDQQWQGRSGDNYHPVTGGYRLDFSDNINLQAVAQRVSAATNGLSFILVCGLALLLLRQNKT
ncbi:DVUA0089 family protein [Alteromonas sp. ASW11-19]|uniref:DVUA0089 family protein n=1 Tax=Alteromonas salexigens TaxID=2982530 RepID=A0ABT2VNP5_9ALTE|nr:DVUA0089 family protein [Alteromonas salexigens]MCU7553871.1 DVUA0089 family protein [Alteromonas salexigens]